MDLSARLSVALDGRYEILREIGRGGMSVVFLARDLRLDREVAIKALRTELTESVGAERFQREIKLVAHFEHIHLLQLHESGTADGVLYYVMPYARDRSLRDRLRKERQLSLDDIVRITSEVADGLEHAHKQGVVHRDIKPENVFFVDGHAVVADFGIAHAYSEAGGETFTEYGIAIGTPVYMSPEQAAGDPHIDHRSDIYSLACVVYEMLSGGPPFEGPTTQAVLAKHMHERVPSLEFVRPGIPDGMAKTVEKALAKVPADRFNTAKAFADALGQASSDEPGAGRRMPFSFPHALLAAGAAAALLLATLYFGSMWGDGANAGTASNSIVDDTASIQLAVLLPELQQGDDRSLATGQLVQHLIASELTRHRGLSVVDPLSLNSRLEGADLQDGADPLGALAGWRLQYVVRATATRSAGGLELTFLLTDARRAALVATDTFTYTEEARLPAQIRTVAGTLIEALEDAGGGIAKTKDIEPWLARPPTELAAVTAFLQGTDYAYRDMPGGGDHFERALRLDPSFVAPRIWLVSGLIAQGDAARAREHVEALLSLKPTATPFEQAMIGWAEAALQGDLESKVRHLRVALRYSPRNNVLLFNLGANLELLGRLEEAVPPIRDAVESRWRFPPLYTLWGVLAIQTGELSGLRETLESARKLAPRDPYLDVLLEALSLFEGNSDAAREYGASFRAQIGEAQRAQTFAEAVPIYRSLAERARTEGQLQRATVLLRRAADADPGSPITRLELARALAEQSDRAAAQAYYRSLKSEEAHAPEVLFLMGEVAAILGLRKEASEHLSQYLDLAPTAPEAVRAQELLHALSQSSSPD